VPVRRQAETIHHPRETDRQRIERELRRQRSLAVSGQAQKAPPHPVNSHPALPEKHIVKRDLNKEPAGADISSMPKPGESPAALPEEKRTIIIGKRKITAVQPKEPDLPAPSERTGPAFPAMPGSTPDEDRMSVDVREQEFQARDEIFRGKGIRKPAVPHARDSALLHTKLRPKQKTPEDETGEDETGDSTAAGKRVKQEGKDKDLSWI
jgi:hypothetical protein